MLGVLVQYYGGLGGSVHHQWICGVLCCGCVARGGSVHVMSTGCMSCRRGVVGAAGVWACGCHVGGVLCVHVQCGGVIVQCCGWRGECISYRRSAMGACMCSDAGGGRVYISCMQGVVGVGECMSCMQVCACAVKRGGWECACMSCMQGAVGACM